MAFILHTFRSDKKKTRKKKTTTTKTVLSHAVWTLNRVDSSHQEKRALPTVCDREVRRIKGTVLTVFYPDSHFTCYKVESSDLWSFRGQNRTIEINLECVIITFNHGFSVFNVGCGSRSIFALRFASGINIDLGPQPTLNTSNPWLNLILH